MLTLTPYSRTEFQGALEDDISDDPVKKAWGFFVKCRQSIGGLGMSKLSSASWAMSLRTRREIKSGDRYNLAGARTYQSPFFPHLSLHSLRQKYSCPKNL